MARSQASLVIRYADSFLWVALYNRAITTAVMP